MASHFHPLIIKSTRQETKDCLAVEFEIPKALRTLFAYQPGQHLTLRTTIKGEEIRRNYSLCSSPLENKWRIAIKKMPFGLFSNWAVENLKAGDTIEVMPAMGKFTLIPNGSFAKNYVAIAAGSGITPVMSILKTILQTEPKSSFTLVYANRDRSSIIFKEELEAIKNKYMQRFMLHPIFSREKSEAPIFEGRIDEQKCQLLFDNLISLQQTDEFFICGPGGMIDTVRHFLEGKQVPKEKIHFELFTSGIPVQKVINPIAATNSQALEQARITIKIDGVQSSFNLAYKGESILEAALQQGADLPYACKGGVCCTCKARLLKGKVTMDVNYGLEEEELAAGYILSCQSHPVTAEVEIDYD